MRIAILGAGNMGCALATVLAKNRHRVALWSIERDVVEDIEQHHRSTKYLPGIRLDERRIHATSELRGACVGADGVVFAVPSIVVAEVARDARRCIAGRTPVLSVAKGIDAKTFQPLPAVIASALGRARDGIAGLAGPAVATEFAHGTPTTVVVAGTSRNVVFWSRAFSRDAFYVAPSYDLIGVSWAAALKNVYAIALGMCDGMQYAMNTKAMLVERAMAEMSIILHRIRAKPETAYGLAGLGDLLVTGFSQHGRNRRFGEMICADEACAIPAVLASMTVEGVAAVEVVHAWLRGKRLRLPLLETIWRVCHRGANPCAALERYLRRVWRSR